MCSCWSSGNWPSSGSLCSSTRAFAPARSGRPCPAAAGDHQPGDERHSGHVERHRPTANPVRSVREVKRRARDDRSTVLEVRDTGVGIAPVLGGAALHRRSIRPRLTAWGWDCRSADRSSRRMAGASRSRPIRNAARVSSSVCRLWRRRYRDNRFRSDRDARRPFPRRSSMSSTTMPPCAMP